MIRWQLSRQGAQGHMPELVQCINSFYTVKACPLPANKETLLNDQKLVFQSPQRLERHLKFLNEAMKQNAPNFGLEGLLCWQHQRPEASCCQPAAEEEGCFVNFAVRCKVKAKRHLKLRRTRCVENMNAQSNVQSNARREIAVTLCMWASLVEYIDNH